MENMFATCQFQAQTIKQALNSRFDFLSNKIEK